MQPGVDLLLGGKRSFGNLVGKNSADRSRQSDGVRLIADT